MVQYAIPVSDGGRKNWSEIVGDGDGDNFDEMDEGFGPGRGSGSGPDDDTSYWEQDVMGAHWEIRCTLNGLTDPLSNVDHFVRGRHRKSATGGRQVDLTLRFDCSGTQIIRETIINIAGSWLTHLVTLTATEADAMTDYAALLMWSFGIEIGGGGPRRSNASAHEFECPDAAGGGGGFAHSQGVIVG